MLMGAGALILPPSPALDQQLVKDTRAAQFADQLLQMPV